MRLTISVDLKDLVQLGQELQSFGREILGGVFQGKAHALRMPCCRGYYQREEDAEIREKLKILSKTNFSGVKTLILYEVV